MSTSLKILVIIPCFNEAPNLPNLFESLHYLDIKVDTLVINDCSSDDTAKIASEYSPCISLIHNLGIGGAVQTGIKYAFQNQYDVCIQLDGDGQHTVESLPGIIRIYQETPKNLIVGSRFVRTGGYRSTRLRRFGIQLIRLWLKVLFHLEISDPTSGFRLMDKKAIAFFSQYYPLDYPEPISLGIAKSQKFSISEVPVIMRPRKFGKSSISGTDSFLYILKILCSLTLIRLERK